MDMARSMTRSMRKLLVIATISLAVITVIIMTTTTSQGLGLGLSEHSHLTGHFNNGTSRNREQVLEYGFIAAESTRPRSLVMKDRFDILNNNCNQGSERLSRDTAQRPRDPAQNPPAELIVNEKHRLIYCNVPKVGCTNWKSIFLQIGGIDDLKLRAIKRLPVNVRGRIYLKYFHKFANISQRQFMLGNFTKFLFVRHPFTRVLSAFLNKLAPKVSTVFTRDEKHDVNWIEEYGMRMIERYRGHEEMNRVKSNWRTEYDLLFPEFIQYLIDNDPMDFDKHWKPITLICRPCDVHYDVIGKYETLDGDADFILREANVNSSITFPSATSGRETNSSSLDVIKRYYQNIPRKKLLELYKVYKDDFELFNYKPETIFKLINK